MRRNVAVRSPAAVSHSIAVRLVPACTASRKYFAVRLPALPHGSVTDVPVQVDVAVRLPPTLTAENEALPCACQHGRENLCRLPACLPHGKGPCQHPARPGSDARLPGLPFAVRPASFAVRMRTAKDKWSLCRPHTHGKGPVIFHFFLFFLYSLHLQNIYIYHII